MPSDSSGKPMTPETSSEMTSKRLPVGTQGWYRLPLYGEWVPATVIDHETDGPIYEPPLEDDLVHLEIQLNRNKHHSARTRGYRMNVELGEGIRQFSLHKPDEADEAVKKAKEQEATRVEIRREQMRSL